VPRKARDIKRALTAKGFQEERRDHWYYVLHVEGKRSSIYTKISHNETDISTPLCSLMARQIKLTNSQFEEFVSSGLKAENYLKLLRASSHLSPRETKAEISKEPENKDHKRTKGR
jgi:hypothetical protein